MRYVIDMIDDLRESIHNASDYTLLAMLLKENSDGSFQNAGEKVISSLLVDDDAKLLILGFDEGVVTTRSLLECVNSLDNKAMMYEVVVKISDAHALMPVIGFGESHEDKHYTFFVTN